MSNIPSPLYFVALVPPEPIALELWQFKMHGRDHFETERALSSPPHITLMPPFSLDAARERDLIDCLQEAVQGHPTFEQELDGWGAFPPRVIYVRPSAAAQLMALQRNVEQALSAQLGIPNPSPYPFSPHLTIAFKDLSPANFERAWAYFSKIGYKRSFEVRQVVVLRHIREERRWAAWQSIDF